jgi:uncharacterized protein (UPF0261 family)
MLVTLMTGNIAIISTLDSYGDIVSFVKEQIEQKGHKSVVIDLSMGGAPSIPADITCGEIAEAGGASIEDIRASRDRPRIIEIMIKGAIQKAKELYSAGRLDGIMSVGGATCALMGTSVMKTLPFGVPKLAASSSASYPMLCSGYFGHHDITMMNTMVDPELSELGKNVLIRVAGAICGMVESLSEMRAGVPTTKTSVAMTTLADCDQCAKYVKQGLTQKGYEVLTFHAQGFGDRAMEELIAQGLFKGVVDLVPGGVSEELFGGPRSAGPNRLEAAGRRGIPQLITPCSLNFISCGPADKIQRKYKKRKLYFLDRIRVRAKMTPAEIKKTARVIADKLNRAQGPTKFVIPLRGWSASERNGDPYYEPELNRLFVQTLRACLRPEIETIEVDAHLEEPAFAEAIVAIFDNMMKLQLNKSRG